MKAGKLNQRITIQREEKITTASNQQVGEWVDVCEIWAQVKCTDSGIIDSNGFVQHEATYKFYIRRREDITAQMRVKWKGRIFNLVGPPIDWNNERTGLTLIAKELV